MVGGEAQASGLPLICSDKVPKEIGVLSTTKFVSLQAPLEIWADTIICNAEKTTRRDTSAEMRAGGFDIVTEAKKLEEFYFDLLK